MIKPIGQRHIRVPMPAAAVVALATLTLALLAGCSGSSTTSTLQLIVDGNGQVEIALEAPGTPTEVVQGDLVDNGWAVRASMDRWSAARRFSDSKDLATQAELLSTALADSFQDSLGFAPKITGDPQLTITSSDFVLAERVTASLTLPSADLTPESCTDCDGKGTSECVLCEGEGGYDCEACGATGRLECTRCDGVGTRECTWCEGTGTQENWDGTTEDCDFCDGGRTLCETCEGARTVECYDCDGAGQIPCSNCAETGTVVCRTCDGSGEPDPVLVEQVGASIDRANLDVAIDMPGMTTASSTKPAARTWTFEGGDVLAGEEISASSWIIDWPLVALTSAGVILAVVLGTWVSSRSIRKWWARRSQVPPTA